MSPTRREILSGRLSSARAVAVRPRSDWAEGRAAKGPLEVEDVRFLLVHHTLQPDNDYGQADVPRLIRGIFDYHTGSEKGWPDVAYNFFVDQFGGVWEGRTGSLSGPVAGSATGGNQGFSQLCCFLGDHTSTPPTAAATSSMLALLAMLADRYGVDTSPGASVQFVSRGSNKWPAGKSVRASTISVHSDMSSTECPGEACRSLVRAEFHQRVSALRSATTTQVAPSTTVAPDTAPAPTSPPTTAIAPTSSVVTGRQGLPESQISAAAPPREPVPARSGTAAWISLTVGGAVTIVGGLVALRRRIPIRR